MYILAASFVAKQLLPDEIPQGRFSYGAMFIAGIFMGEKITRQFSGDIFQKELSLNRPNHSATVQIFQRSQNTFNVASTNYSS